jgi:hypothetical protein
MQARRIDLDHDFLAPLGVGYLILQPAGGTSQY